MLHSVSAPNLASVHPFGLAGHLPGVGYLILRLLFSRRFLLIVSPSSITDCKEVGYDGSRHT
jgi:hypothetical protein